MKKTVIIILAIIALVFAGANYFFPDKKSMPVSSQPPQQNQQTSYKNITSRKLNSMLADKDFFFVNVHIPYEGEIEKTDAFIPYNEIENNLDKLPKAKNAKIILYCRSGRMSEIAAEKLVSLGYSNVYNLTGGMIDWEKQGNTLIQNPK